MTTKIPHIIHVDLQSHAKRQIVYMKQGDEMSRELLIFFYNGGVVWSVPSEITSVSLSYCKADKVHGCYDHIAQETAYVFNEGRTSVTMAIHPQVLTAAGNVICELKLCNASGHALNTFNFVINCEQSPHAMGQKSEGYWNNVFDGATFTPHISEDGVLSWTNDKDLPNPDPVQIDDGATFTPHVSDAGILSWTNDKGLPNPSPIDLKQFVVSPDDIPVVPMDIVTSENAAENVGSDDKIITPKAAKKLIDLYGGGGNLRIFTMDDVTTDEIYALTENVDKAIFFAYNVSTYTPDPEADPVEYPYAATLLLLKLSGFSVGNGRKAVFEQDADLWSDGATVRKTVRVTVQSGAQAGDPDVKTVEIVPTEIDSICPPPISVVLLPESPQYFNSQIRAFADTTQYARYDYCYRKPDNDTYTHFYYCKNSSGHQGAWIDADFKDLGKVLDPTLDASLAAVNWTDYIPAAERGMVSMLGRGQYFRQALAFDSVNRTIVFSRTDSSAAMWLNVTFNASGEISGCEYDAFSYASA